MKINFNNISLYISAGFEKQFPKDERKKIVFSGRSNVGKSSLINSLVSRKGFAYVSSSPGKTVTLNFYDIDGKIWFVDLPGYGFAKKSYDKKSDFSSVTDKFLSDYAEKDSTLFFQLVDMKVGPTEDDWTMIDWLEQTEKNYVIIATKCDKLNKTDFNEALTELNKIGKKVIPYSSPKNIGRDETIKTIVDFCV